MTKLDWRKAKSRETDPARQQPIVDFVEPDQVVVSRAAVNFHGFKGYTALIKKEDDDPEGVLHNRLLGIMNHGDHSLFEPLEMVPENKEFFRRMLSRLRERYTFNPELFEEPQQAAAE